MAGAGAVHDGRNEEDAQSDVRRRMQDADHAPLENPGRKGEANALLREGGWEGVEGRK